MNNLEHILGSLGLTDNESKIYLSALSLGTCAASIIANRVSLPRSTTRYTCEQLVKKQLMTMTKKGNSFLFTPEPPEKLKNLIKIKKVQLDKQQEELERNMGDFKNIYNPHSKLPKVTFFDGIDGVLRMTEEITNKRRNIVEFGAGDYFLEHIPGLVNKFRRKSYIQFKDLKILRSKKYKKSHKQDPVLIDTKYFKKLEELKVNFHIADDIVAITSIEDNAPVGILIKHKDIAQAFHELFFEIWDNAED